MFVVITQSISVVILYVVITQSISVVILYVCSHHPKYQCRHHHS